MKIGDIEEIGVREVEKWTPPAPSAPAPKAPERQAPKEVPAPTPKREKVPA